MAQQPEQRAKTRIGVLVPFTNTNLEPDLQFMCAPDTSFHFTRIGGYGGNEVPGAAEMARMAQTDIANALHLIAGCQPQAVLYGCTSATLEQGRAFDLDLAARIRAATGAISITAAGAIVASLKALGVAKVGLATPYEDEINARTVQFLASESIQTVACAGVDQSLLSHEQGLLCPAQIEALAVRADHPDAEAIVLACTDMRAVEVITRVEMIVKKPVVTSNQAMVFAVTNQLDLGLNPQMPGRLFQVHSGKMQACLP